MFLRKIVSTFVCFGLFGCCGCVRGSNVTSADGHHGYVFQDNLCSICLSQQLGNKHVLSFNFEIDDAYWMNDKEYVQEFINMLRNKINVDKGKMPSIKDIGNAVKAINTTSGILTINDGNFANIKQNQLNDANCVVFDGVTWDYDHLNQFFKVKIFDFNAIKFIDCKLSGDTEMGFADIINGCNIKNLSIINSGLTDDDLIWVVNGIGDTDIDTIDVSNNLLTKDVIPGLDEVINSRGMSITSIKLYGNQIEKKDIAACREGFYYV